MLSELSNITLKPVETKTTTLSKDIIKREEELNRRLLQADMDFWYNAVATVTYKTTFIPLSPDTAQTMINIYQSKQQGETHSEDDQSKLDTLESLIASSMTALCDGLEAQDGVFVKLASRSPKDATNREQVKEEILIELLEKKREESGGERLSPNDIIGAVFQAHISSFRLYTAKEVLETLLSSDRVVMDELPLVLEHVDCWKEQIVVRKWCDLPIQFEFRGFVYDDRLTALCQYYDEVCYDDVVENRLKIQDLILAFFETVKNDIPIEPKEYVLDFLVDIDKEIVYIVEINPFGKPDGMGTGTVMFDPKKPEDFAVLFGEAEFEFRIETEKLSQESYADMLGPQLKNIVKAYE